MLTLIVGLVVFIGMHSISIVFRPLRNRLYSANPLMWRAGYSVVSLIGFILIIYGYMEARANPIVIYTPPLWMRHLVMLLMVPVFPLVVASYTPSKIRQTLKHPMLVAIKLWALSHLLANGMLADLLLFGSFLAWAVITRISIKRRNEPLKSFSARPLFDIASIILGLAAYGLFVVWGHSLLIGMPLIPA